MNTSIAIVLVMEIPSNMVFQSFGNPDIGLLEIGLSFGKLGVIWGLHRDSTVVIFRNSTLNPKPSTLSPKPYTLSPKP